MGQTAPRLADGMTVPLRDAFLAAMARVAATVNIVTTDGPAGRAGVTVSAMSSVSADGEAPTLLVCVHYQSSAAPAILENGTFAVNILRDDQSWISDTFARRREAPGGDKFAAGDWHAMPSGAPRVEGAVAAFDCRVLSSERVGTHHIFIGEVTDVHLAATGTPLLYHYRSYGAPARHLAPTLSATPGRTRIGCLASFGPSLLPRVLASLEKAGGPVDLDLHEGDQRQLLELLRDGAIELAFLYDLALPPGISALPVMELQPYVLLPAAHPLAARAEITLDDLRAERMVLLDAPPSRDYFLSLFGETPPAVSYRAKSLEMVRGMVGHGLGFSLLATRPARDESHDGTPLATRPLAGRHPSSRLALASIAGRPLSTEAEGFQFHTAHIFGLDPD